MQTVRSATEPGLTFLARSGQIVSLPGLAKLEREGRPCEFESRQVAQALETWFGSLAARFAPLKSDRYCTAAELKARLVRIAFQVTRDHLEKSFNEFKSGRMPAVLNQLSDEERRSLQAASFDGLNNEQLHTLLRPYRQLTCEKQAALISSSFFTHGITSEKSSLFGQLSFLKSFAKTADLEKLEQEQMRLASSEYLCRTLPASFPYPETLSAERLKGTIFPILTETGEVQLFQLQESLREDTLAMEILVPLTKGQWPGKMPAIVLFRDTSRQDRAATAEEWQEKVELFAAAKQKICEKLSPTLKGACDLVIASSRLGSVYAQSLLGAIAETRNSGWLVVNGENPSQHYDEQNPLNRVERVTLLAWDPEPVPQAFQREYALNIQGCRRSHAHFEVRHEYVFFRRPLRASCKGYLLGDPSKETAITHIELQDPGTSWPKSSDETDDRVTVMAGHGACLSIRTLTEGERRQIVAQRFGYMGNAWAASASAPVSIRKWLSLK